MSQRICTQH